MNKLKKLYDISKVMKNEDIYAGTAQLKIYKGDVELFFGNNEFVKNRVEKSMSSNYLVKIDSDMGTICHNGNVSYVKNKKGTHPHSHMHRHHGHHKHMWSTLTTFFKFLNEVEAIDLEDGRSQLTYVMEEVPKEWIEKVRAAHSDENCKSHHHKHMEFLKDIQPISMILVITVSNSNKIEKVEGEFTAIQQDTPIKGEGFIVLK